MTPVWASIIIGLVWSIINAVWAGLNIRMENRLLRDFVTRETCKAECGTLAERMKEAGV
jgi:hypothetical protein